MKLLIISPHFPPTNAADHQRVRLVLPYLRENGWAAEVLAVDAGSVASPMDDWLAAGLPADVPVHRVPALGLGWSRIPGLGTLTFRALGALRRKGDELLKIGRFDLIFFSTTQFGVHVLGPRWRRKFGIPFVMDYQDPWVNDYYRNHPAVTPPGGRLKYAVMDWLHRRQEPRVLRHCAGLTSVSADYPRQLSKRYRWLNIEILKTEKLKSEMRGEQIRHLNPTLSPDEAEREGQAERRGRRAEGRHRLLSLVLPFPGDERDLQRVATDGTRQTIFSRNDGKLHWVYVGRGGADMHLALRAFFLALNEHLKNEPALRENLRLHFIGTSYAAAGRGRKMVEPLAAELGLADVVSESTDRIPYSQTLRCLLDAHALIVPGSDDPGYTASKIYPYLLAGKPLLAVFHEQSSVVALMQTVRGGTVVAFKTGETPETIAARILDSGWLSQGQNTETRKTEILKSENVSACQDVSVSAFKKSSVLHPPAALDRSAFAPHTARAQAAVLAEFFKQILASGKQTADC